MTHWFKWLLLFLQRKLWGSLWECGSCVQSGCAWWAVISLNQRKTKMCKRLMVSIIILQYNNETCFSTTPMDVSKLKCGSYIAPEIIRHQLYMTKPVFFRKKTMNRQCWTEVSHMTVAVKALAWSERALRGITKKLNTKLYWSDSHSMPRCCGALNKNIISAFTRYKHPRLSFYCSQYFNICTNNELFVRLYCGVLGQ